VNLPVKPKSRLTPLPIDHVPELKESFQTYVKSLGFVPNSALIMQRKPKLVKALAQLAAAVWDPQANDFRIEEIIDFLKLDTGVPLEIYFNGSADRLYVTTAKPGHLHIFDISKDPLKPVLIKSLAAAEGAHHVAFTKDWAYAFVQNTLLNLPGLSDGSVTVIDLKNEKVVSSMDALRDAGYNPNSIVLLPQWNDPAGH